MCGVVVVVSSSIGSPNLVGDLLALTAVAAFSTNMNVWRRYREQSRFIGLSIAASVTIVITVWFAAPFGLSAQVYLAAIGMGLLFNPIGRLCLTSAPRHAPPPRLRCSRRWRRWRRRRGPDRLQRAAVDANLSGWCGDLSRAALRHRRSAGASRHR